MATGQDLGFGLKPTPAAMMPLCSPGAPKVLFISIRFLKVKMIGISQYDGE